MQVMLLFVWVFLCAAYYLLPCGSSGILNSTAHLVCTYTSLQIYAHTTSEPISPKTQNHPDPDFTRPTISRTVPKLFFDDFSYVLAVALERVWVKKPEEENNIKSDAEMPRVGLCN